MQGTSLPPTGTHVPQWHLILFKSNEGAYSLCWFTNFLRCLLSFLWYIPGADPEIWKKVVLYVGHHGWPTKKILSFRWSKKSKITLEIISFGRNISISIFNISPFLYTMKVYR